MTYNDHPAENREHIELEFVCSRSRIRSESGTYL